jgi:hypothetical protein
VTITATPRFGLVQWGAGADSPSRTGFNDTLDRIDDRAAYDDGAVGGTALPTTELAAGRYAQTVNGSYRQLYRRVAGAWQQVGGNTWAETQYDRAAAALPVTDPARIRSHPNLTNPTVVENWDGSSLRGGRQQIGDVNSGQPGALHVGDITSAVDLAVRGRVFARTTADNQRGFVASAHAATAGNLFSAIEAGGTVPWLVDAQGRMRAQAPTAFGGAALAAGVPLSAAPGSSDTAAADLYAAASGKFALRVLRALGDATPIASFAQDRITLGRASWAGGRVDVLGPGAYVAGLLEVDGLAQLDGGAAISGGASVAGGLTVSSGTTTVGALGASAASVASLTATGAVSGASLASSGAATVSGDTTLSGRLKLPTSQPSGSSSGQIRISSDWVLEVYNGSTWKGRFGNGGSSWKHAWSQTGALNGIDSYAKVAAWTSDASGNVATMSNGDLLLNRAGLWAITASFFNDAPVDGINRLELRWEDGAFPGVTKLADYRTRQSAGINGAGQGQCTITWVGYVNSSAAAAALEMWVACRTANGSTSTFAEYHLSAEYLSA